MPVSYTHLTKDKTLYRANMWLFFRRARRERESVPAYYFELHPEYWAFGCWGAWGRGEMEALREMILAEDRLFLDAFRAVNSCPQVQMCIRDRSIIVQGDHMVLEQIMKQLAKLEEVMHVVHLEEDSSCCSELVFVKLHTPDVSVRSDIRQLCDLYGACLLYTSVRPQDRVRGG